MSDAKTRKIEVGALSRVEGEGALRVVVKDQTVVDVQLAIYEPPRFFEALLRGRPLEEAPDITSRICGICPVAYQMTSVHALEQALGVSISPEIRRLRRLLYCAEWIESHGVHMHLLHIPDFFGCDSSIELAKQYPEEVNRGLRLKKHGNQLLEVIGGRAVNPINVAVGGFHRAPDRGKLRSLIDDYCWGLDAAVAVTRWVAQLDFPDLDRPCEMIALQHDDEYPMNEGRIASTKGWNIEVPDYEQRFAERQSPHSTALHSVRLPAGTPYCVGPQARVNLNRDRLAPVALQLSGEIGIQWPSFNPYHSILARALEVVHSYEESLQILRSYQPPQPSRIEYQPRPGQGVAATEAPRGLIYNRYQVDASGLIQCAKIVPPTSQNQRQIESDLRTLLPDVLGGDDRATALACEKLIRSYDPCISCSTHFLRLEVERR